jgi:hypothetical protein
VREVSSLSTTITSMDGSVCKAEKKFYLLVSQKSCIDTHFILDYRYNIMLSSGLGQG